MKKSLQTFCCICLFQFGIAVVYGAEVTLESVRTSVSEGETFELDVQIDTQGEKINTIQARITVPEFLSIVGIDDSRSVTSFWVDEPTLTNEKSVFFSGIVPGGILSDKANVLRLSVTAVARNQGVITVTDTSVLLHDGLGTSIPVLARNLHISVAPGTPSVVYNTKYDDEIPEDFSPLLTRDPDVFDGNVFIVFKTEDKGTGIHHYAVKEGFFGRFSTTKSPYLLKHQTLDRKIQVKAVDVAGNERTVIVYPQNKEPWHEHPLKIVSILVVCIGILLLFFVYKRRRL